MGRPKGLAKTGGKPKGYKAPSTLEKEAARELVRKRITERLVPLIDAQIDSSIGIKHFMLRDELTGQWKRLTNPNQIIAALNHPKAREGSTYFIYTKDPNSQAAREMLDRAIDRPKEQPHDVNINATDEMVAILQQARDRAAKKAGPVLAFENKKKTG